MTVRCITGLKTIHEGIYMLDEERAKEEIMKFCREELGRQLNDMEVEERDRIFRVKIGNYYTRVDRRHVYDYMHGDRNDTGRKGMLSALLNAKRK